MFTIIAKDWYKRRTPSENKVSPVEVDIPDYQATHNHICNMAVSYSDGSSKVLIARVLFNEFTHQWTVDGMEVSVRVYDDNASYQKEPQSVHQATS